MYLEIENGTILNVQGLNCWIPPVGFIVDIESKKLINIGVYKRSDIQEEQYWERIKEPDWYWSILKQEENYNKKKSEGADPFFEEKYELYKQQEWSRRLNGFWFMSNGMPIYLTGAHYLYLQHIKIDIGYPKYRLPDLEYFYFQQYVIEDPNCMGMLEITKRRFGKTFRGGVFVLDYPTRTKMTNGTIQSKTGADAKKVFAKAVVDPFKKLPRFFKPEYDLSGGVTPKSELRFQNTNVRGKKAEETLEKEELGSLIDYYSADALATDGQKIHRKFDDEWAKTIECNIYDRHDVTRYCLMDDEGRIIGKVLYSSTVEALETEKDGVQEAAINLWNDSDQLNKGENGRTASGLYRFFMSAIRAKNFDIYGVPDEVKTEKEIDADRATVKNNARSLAARIRKEPKTIDEAFYAGNDKCEFNAENITNQIKAVELEQPYWRQSRLVLKKEAVKSILPSTKDVVKQSVGYMDDVKGGWFILEQPNEPNKFLDRGGYLEPNNKHLYQIGVDTTQDRIAVSGSNPAITVFKKSCKVDGEETGMYPVALWISPTRLDIHFDEEVLKACMWYGCKANYEIDRRTDFYRYFCDKKCQEFLTWTPKILMNPLKPTKRLEYGSRSGDPFQLAQMLQISKWYIDGDNNEDYNGHVHRIKHIGLLQQTLKYDHLDRTKSDLFVSLQMALVACFGEMQKPIIPNNIPKSIMPTFKLQIYN
jgi:hypothetical protein